MIKNISAVASPLAKSLVETFITPKLQKLQKKLARKNALIDATFSDTFQEYLARVYEKNAVLNTLAFRKRKVLLSDVYQPLTIVDSETEQEYLIEGFEKNLFSQSYKILITDTAGMGKSTIVKRLLTSCIEQNLGIPILIELRRLSTTKGLVDEILEQINPINDSIDKQLILDLVDRGDFIFFLDGFDEIPIDHRNKVSKNIQTFISKAGSNRFVLTSRPEDSLSAFGDFIKFEIKQLSDREAFDLIKKYDSSDLASTLITKIQEPENFKSIQEYLTTPLLVSLLFTAFEYKQQIPFKKHIFYRQVYDALFESHDLSKGESFTRQKHCGLAVDEFHRVLRVLGYFCFLQNNKIEFTKDELLEIVQKSISYCSDLEVNSSDFIKDIVTSVPLFTIDGTYFRWNHKSLQEYFAAQFIYLDSKGNQEEILLKLCFHERNRSFLNILDLYESIDPNGFRSIVVKRLLEVFLESLDTTYKHFSGPQKTLRQQLIFGIRVFVVLSKKTTSGENDQMDLLASIPDCNNAWYYAASNIERNVIIEVQELPTNRIINFLGKKKFPFVSLLSDLPPVKRIKNEISAKKTTDQLVLDYTNELASDEVIQIKDDKESDTNQKGTFENTNKFLALILSGHTSYTIKPKEARGFLSEISERNNLFDSQEFLLGF